MVWMIRWGAMAWLLGGLMGCASSKGPEPTPLTDIQASVAAQSLWSSTLRIENESTGLQATLQARNLWAASEKGNIKAFDVESGEVVWQAKLNDTLLAGPTVTLGAVYVVTSQAEVVALDRQTQSELWRAPLRGEILSSVAEASGVVVARAADGHTTGLDAKTGEALWVFDEHPPLPLTVRGTSAPTTAGKAAWLGYDDGYVTLMDVTAGTPVWETRVGVSRGTNDIARLTDIDGTPVLVDEVLYVSALNQRTAEVHAKTGRVQWSHPASSVLTLAVDWSRVIAVTTKGEVVSIRRASGQTQWQNDALLYRDLGAPALMKNWVLLGDADGVLHMLDAQSGDAVGRVRVGSAIVQAPLIANDVAVVVTAEGRIRAYRLTDQS